MTFTILKTAMWELLSKSGLTFDELVEDMGIHYNFDNLSLDVNKNTFTFDIMDEKKLCLSKIKYGI